MICISLRVTPGTEIQNVVAPSCGVVVWTSPSNAVRHAVRFFTGESMETTAASERELQRLFDDPNSRYAVATNLPSDCSTVLYAQVLNATTACDFASIYKCTHEWSPYYFATDQSW